jgi:drug/metabolite transporter (DMT)-like permease
LSRLLPAEPSAKAALVALTVLNLVWGGSLPATKVALASFSPLVLTALRLVVAALLFGWLVGIVPIIRLGWKQGAVATGLGVIGYTGTQALQAIGTAGTDAASATVLMVTAPLWIAILAAVVLQEKVTLASAAGLVLALAGVVLVSGLAEDWPPNGSALSGLIVLAAGAALALYTVLGKAALRRVEPLVFIETGCIGGAITSLPLGMWQASTQPQAPTLAGWLMLAYLALVVTFAGFIVWFWGVRAVPAGQAGALMFLQPVSGLTLSAAILGDHLSSTFLTGAALVLIGTYLAAAFRRHGS